MSINIKSMGSYVYLLFLNIMNIINILMKSIGKGHITCLEIFSDITIPAKMITIIIIFSISYIWNNKMEYNIMEIVLYKNKKKLWLKRVDNIIIRGLFEVLIMGITVMSFLLYRIKVQQNIEYILAFVISLYFQLMVGYIFIELMFWIFSSKIIGILFIICIAILDSFTEFIPLFYGQVCIYNEIKNMNISAIAIKSVDSVLVCCLLIMAGVIYAKRKEFI